MPFQGRFAKQSSKVSKHLRRLHPASLRPTGAGRPRPTLPQKPYRAEAKDIFRLPGTGSDSIIADFWAQ